MHPATPPASRVFRDSVPAGRTRLPRVHLSALFRCHVLSPTDESVGKVDDVIVRLRGGDLPVVTGLVAKVGGRRVYVSIRRISELSERRVALAKAKVDLRGFEGREGEVLLRGDI